MLTIERFLDLEADEQINVINNVLALLTLPSERYAIYKAACTNALAGLTIEDRTENCYGKVGL